MKTLLLIISIISIRADTQWKLVGAPLLHVHPCNDTADVTVAYEPGKPPDEENEYKLQISKEFPAQTVMVLKFDAEASVTLTEKSYARLSVDDNDDFNVRFFKSHQGITFNIKGPVNSHVVPYLTYLEINSANYCQNAKVGYLDQYIEGYKDHAETKKKLLDQSCGRRKIKYTELIVNGATTQPGDWPWHVAIYRLDKTVVKYICGGTLISKSFVLTAAHCTTIRGAAVLPEILSVVLGKYNLIGGDAESEEREVHSIIVHEDFALKNLNNDIALLKLKTEVTYNDYIQPACIWQASAYERLPTNRVYGTVVGWGFDNTDHLSTQLKSATMPKVSESKCIKRNPVFYATVLNDKKFCAGLNNGTSACNGDSGGGFSVFVPDIPKDSSTNGAWYVRGIVSLSAKRSDAPVCDPYMYVVFTDVAKYGGWIRKHLKH
ncbi:unnamed protein product [Colias eurytheme]|nr:unnamed protein product [Colias eurytheme]